ncbi:MAG: NAD(P)/FAD-dependent oxidoreductase [Gammaproteobacteria bacterium]|nr:NAD(P)/FAD-dependent oxidoreductase [Gammaproteobacteria bacterium]
MTKPPTYDVVIIGGGHNGLICGAYLARAGLRVVVVEQHDVVGGAAVTQEFHPGFRASTFSYLMSLLHPKIIADLELRQHGLEVLPCSDMFSPLDGDDYIVYSDDVERTRASFGRFSPRDAAVYPEFNRYLYEAADVVRSLLFETPPDPSKRDWKTFKRIGSLLWKHREIGGRFFQVYDILTMSADDYLKRWFEDSRIRAVLAYYASIGTFAGPKTPGSAYVIMHHIMGEHEGAGGWGFIRGGMGKITEAIADHGRANGLEIVTGAWVDQVKVANGRVTGIATRDGREFDADVVVSNASAKALYLDMIGAEHLPDDLLRDIRNMRTFSTAFKINIACDRPPQYKGLQKAIDEGALGDFQYPTYVHCAPDIDYLEKAYDDAKHGWYSERPFMTPVVPTIVDDSLAPAGKHVVNLFGGHAPHELRDGSWADEKENFTNTVFDTLDGFAPGFTDDIIATEVLLAPDIEARVNLPQGHIFHGELALDQLFFKRPAPHYADYRGPLKGLYMCGSSCHPGGGVSGIPGHNAAREILRDVGKRRRAP